MKHLNRKEYKQTLRDFRKTCPISRIQHKWVRFKNEYRGDVLMFVYDSVIKRTKNHYCQQFNSYNYNGFYFDVILHGAPTIEDAFDGLKIDHYIPRSIIAHKNEKFQVLEGDEVENAYEKIFEKAKRYHMHKFQAKKNKE